eukprot:TRINITY_DN15696_c0_g3_i1.p1 TRINITY_DN15696_c0_g3~~TRINITY_DN15696_c0_g3_i1.p1  ORF type:complete len:582 (-),score=50.89 TRINITY_DN15696_c0_g3_i1:86-1777(-)
MGDERGCIFEACHTRGDDEVCAELLPMSAQSPDTELIIRYIRQDVTSKLDMVVEKLACIEEVVSRPPVRQQLSHRGVEKHSPFARLKHHSIIEDPFHTDDAKIAERRNRVRSIVVSAAARRHSMASSHGAADAHAHCSHREEQAEMSAVTEEVGQTSMTMAESSAAPCPDVDRPDSQCEDNHERRHAFDKGASSSSFLNFYGNTATFNQTSEEARQKIIDTIRHQRGVDLSTLRNRVFLFIENPLSSRRALVFSTLFNMLILASVVVAFFHTFENTFWSAFSIEVVQAVFESFFAVELMLRFWVSRARCSFVLNLFNWIDILSVLPLVIRIAKWVDYLGSSIPSIESAVVISLPLLRLLKLLRRFEKLQLLIKAFLLAVEALPVLLYCLALIALLFSELLYFVELNRNDWSLSTSLWFTMVTMTTVGYGDTTPSASMSSSVAVTLMIVSALYMAIPIGIVGNAFSQVWNDRDRLLVMHRFREAFNEGGFTVAAVQEIFQVFDEDDSGELDISEFSTMLQGMNMRISEDRICLLFQSLDSEGTGRITMTALCEGLIPRAFAGGI